MGAIEKDVDQTARLLCQFVKEYFDPPNENEHEPWCEAVCAALFSVSFSAFIRSAEIQESYDAFHHTLDATIESVTRYGAQWVNEQLTLERLRSGINVDVTELIRVRLTAYFNEAIHAVCDRGYGIEAARSHACFVVLQQVGMDLLVRRVLHSAAQSAALLENAMATCESISCDLLRALG